MMDLEYFCVVFVLSILVPSNVSRVIPKENQIEDWDYRNWKRLGKYEDGLHQTTDVEEDDNQGKTFNIYMPGGEKIKKSKKFIPQASINDTRYPDKPDLVLLALPSEFMMDERAKLLEMVEAKFGHLIDTKVLKKVANGDNDAVPNIWNYLSDFDVKGAFTAVLAEQFFKNFASADEHPVVPDVTREECKKLCKDKEVQLFQLINNALIQLTEKEVEKGDDIRMRIRPAHKKCFKYEPAGTGKHSECTCLSVGKSIYVSPHLKEIIDKKFFNSNEGEKEIEELIENTFIGENPAEGNKRSSGWSFAKLGHAVMSNIGYGSEKRRGREPKRYDKSWFASHTEWILVNAIVNILILGFCFPLWPFHVMFFLIGWFFV